MDMVNNALRPLPEAPIEGSGHHRGAFGV